MSSESNFILYGLTSTKTGQKYIGVHKDDHKFENYKSSSKNPYLKEAFNQGEIERVILARGTKKEICSQEYFYLNKFDAIKNPKFFNGNQGGGEGLDKTYRPTSTHEERVTKWVTDNVWVDQESNLLEPENILADLEMRKLAGEIENSINAWKNGSIGKYAVEEMSVHKLYVLPRIQARAVLLDQKKVNEITEAFRNFFQARKHLTPIIVLVKDNEPCALNDGNHRIEAAHRAGWDTYPVIKIDDSVFKDSEFMRTLFGNMMNHVEGERKGNNLDDLTERLKQLKLLYPEYDYDSCPFKEIAKARLGGKNTKDFGLWKNADVVRKCDQLAEITRENVARSQYSQHFLDYSKERIISIWERSEHYNEYKVIVQTPEGINTGGVGGAISYAVETLKNQGVNEANLIIHIKSLSKYTSGEAAKTIDKLYDVLKHGVNSKINVFFVDPHEEKIVTKFPGL
jgi:hypothetical protein